MLQESTDNLPPLQSGFQDGSEDGDQSQESYEPRATVCAQSFLQNTDNPVKSPGRLRGLLHSLRVNTRARHTVLIATASAIAVACAGVAINSRVAYAVYFNGEPVTAAATRAEAVAAVESAEMQLVEIFGEPVPLADAVSLELTVAPNASNRAEEVESAILNSVKGVTEAFALVVDGEIIGAAEDSGSLAEILTGIYANYSTAATEELSFVNDVTVEKRFVAEDMTRDAAEIAETAARIVTVTRIDRLRTEVEIPFEVAEQGDAGLYIGESAVITEGAPGLREIVERVTYVNEKEVSRETFAGALIALPTTKVVAVGTTERPRTMSYGEYHYPVEDAVITSRFGYRSSDNQVGSSNHQGVDFAGSRGQSILAADGGLVVFAGEKTGYGRLIIIEHDNGDLTYYAHNNALVAAEGERVARGDLIAKMGSSGVSSGVHCHFEIRPGGGEPVDPMPYLDGEK